MIPEQTLAEIREVAQNVVHNGGISSDHVKYALDVVNSQLVALARAYLDLLDRSRPTPEQEPRPQGLTEEEQDFVNMMRGDGRVSVERLLAIIDRLSHAQAHTFNPKDARELAGVLAMSPEEVAQAPSAPQVTSDEAQLLADCDEITASELWAPEVDRVARALRALIQSKAHAPRGADGWRPISEAPKDGTAFLAYGVHSDDDPSGAARGVKRGDHWWAILLFDVWQQYRFRFAKDGTFPWSEPTHWMPLPAPPSAAEQRGRAEPVGEKA